MSNELCVMPIAEYEDICDAIREKTGTSAVIKSGDMATLIESIQIGVDCSNATASVENVEYGKTYYGADGLKHTGTRTKPQLYAPTAFAYNPETHQITITNDSRNGKFGTLYMTFEDNAEKQISSPYTLTEFEEMILHANDLDDEETSILLRYKADNFNTSSYYQINLKTRFILTITTDEHTTITATVTRNGSSVTLTNGDAIYYGETVTWVAAVTDPSLYQLTSPEQASNTFTVVGDRTISATSGAYGAYVVLNATGDVGMPFITFVGSETATEAFDYNCTITSDTGYHLPTTIDVYIGGVLQTVNDGYTYNNTTGEITINNLHINGNIRINASGQPNSYIIAISQGHCIVIASVTRNNASVNLSDGDTVYYAESIQWRVVSVEYGYELDNVGVDNTTVVTGNMSIGGTALPMDITVTGVLNHLTLSTNPGNPKYKGGLDIYLIPDTYYELPEVMLVKVDGNDFNNYSYNSQTGTISIAANLVTGNVVVYARASQGVECELSLSVNSHISAIFTVVRNGITNYLYDESLVRVGEVINWTCTAQIGWQSLNGYSGTYTVENTTPSITIAAELIPITITITKPTGILLQVMCSGENENITRSFSSSDTTCVIPSKYGYDLWWNAYWQTTTLDKTIDNQSGTINGVVEDTSLEISWHYRTVTLNLTNTNAMLAVSTVRNGNFVGLINGDTVYYGEILSISANPSYGYYFAESIPSSITVDGQNSSISISAIGTRNKRAVRLNGVHCTIYAYYLSSATTITPISDGDLVEEGTTVYWSITAVDEGYGALSGVTTESSGTETISLGYGTNGTDFTITKTAYPLQISCDLNVTNCEVTVRVTRNGAVETLALGVSSHATYIAYPGETLEYYAYIYPGYHLEGDAPSINGYSTKTWTVEMTAEDTAFVPKYIFINAT